MYNYPNQKKVQNQEIVDLNNGKARGMNFEDFISQANSYYNAHNIANIHKKPTPIKIIKVVNYKETIYNKSKITEAVFDKKSTTDYNGIYKGYYIDFEAKETINKTFNIKSNLHKHQIDHLLSIKSHGGIAFILISMKYYNKIYAIDIKKLLKHQKVLVTIEFLKEQGYEVNQTNSLYLDYLKYVDDLLERKSNG